MSVDLSVPSPDNYKIIEVVERFEEPLWRLNNLYTCVTEKGKKVLFRMNWAQYDLFQNMWFWNIILKSRQHGFTTEICILGLDSALFNDNYSVGINAHTRDDAEKIFDKKVKFPYNELPDRLKSKFPADTNTAKMLKFPNGSSVEVGTSLRSGTYQFLHISEFGKVCAKFPDKATEIVTGTLETIHQGSICFIESTAEGNAGYFHDYCQEAIRLADAKVPLNKLQYKFHFYPWFKDPKNEIETRYLQHILITKEQHAYFDRLRADHGIMLNNGQKAWYAEKERKLGGNMKREHPSTPEEAFEASVEGAYFGSQMAGLRKNGRITIVPHVPNVPVNTGWDLGIGDEHWLWFHQRVALQDRIIYVIHNSGEGLNWYVKEMDRLPYIYGNHFVPHDAGHKQLNILGGISIADQLEEAGLNNVLVIPKTATKDAAIEESRNFLPQCWIDKENCDEGVKCLDNYRKEWDDKRGCFRNKPLHDWASHGYDGFESLARGLTMHGPGELPSVEHLRARRGRRPPKDWRIA